MRRGESIYLKKDGRWEARYLAGYDAVTGKGIYKSVYGLTKEEAATKREAKLYALTESSDHITNNKEQHLNLLILGAGSHGLNVYEIAEQLGVFEKIAFLDDKVESVGKLQILGHCSDAVRLRSEYPCAFVAIGNVKQRTKWVRFLKKYHYMFPRLISPAAHISTSSTIGEGTCVLPEATVNASTRIGSFCIVANRALVDADATVGDFVHLDNGAIVSIGAKIPSERVVGAGEIVK